MEDIKRKIGTGIPINIEDNPRREGKEHVKAMRSVQGSAIISRQVPQKLKNLEIFTISIEIGNIHFRKALCDLGASINLMSLSIYEKLRLQSIDRSLVHPKGVLEDVLAKVCSFINSVDFVILNFEEDREIPILLDRPFLATSKSTIDLEKNKFTMKINGETKIFKCGHQQDEVDKKKL
ncbi:hypothetical protein EPI10_024339 [Gossypium australe]|uniref:Retrovirus-related Pol polyprotein from transposon opus n=1 Tax=Gossypium australe TaxID=47621 RepID=A0A5B6VYD1_9ROSI|nr:hypothetical protein EPI10_024339 [Gossypium australe]